jgi:8-oxo-dGTP diphosphatase
MSKPSLRAEGIICTDDFSRVLVQCDKEESFYRFPGGSIEFGETAAEAIIRELIEEFDLEVEVNTLALINESIVEYDGKKRHDCTLLHWCELKVDGPQIQWA